MEFHASGCTSRSGVGTDVDVEITTRIPGIAGTNVVTAQLDGGAITGLSLGGMVATGSITVPVDDAQHTLVVTVESDGGTTLASQAVSFTVKDASAIPLALERREPENQSKDVEANESIMFYFNRPIDRALLEISVKETVRGHVYDVPQAADITEQSNVKLVEIHKDQEVVEGGLSYLPSIGQIKGLFEVQRRWFWDDSGRVYVSFC
ncbi:MAG: hypothetical protein GY854_18870 [Deltaproteobacteria bacterium]|nr:hypothetical protein [Deltaproteobacteria bacterium]